MHTYVPAFRPPWRNALTALLAMAALLVAAATAGASQTTPKPGKVEALKGGYRDAASNTGSGYAKPLAGATFEHDTSTSFPTGTAFGPTDAAGSAVSDTVPPGTRYVRETMAPAGWSPPKQLHWDGADRALIASAAINGGTTTAKIGDLARFPNVVDNPVLDNACDEGIRVLLLLDTSGSTKGFGDEYNKAAKTFVDTLAGTDTTLRISSFASTSKPGTVEFDLMDDADRTAADAEIDKLYPNDDSGSGSTNWDAALQDAAKADVDVIVFVTDGNPTVNQSGGSGSDTTIQDIAYGVASANLAKHPEMDPKGATQRIIAVGVGDLAPTNLIAVSGPVEGEDYTTTTDPAELAAVLAKIASDICSGTLVIQKDLAPDTDPGTFDLLLDEETVATGVGDGGSTEPLTLRSGTYTVGEAGANGTALADYNAAISCTDSTGVIASGTGSNLEVPVATDESVTCTITNTRKTGTLTVTKALSPTTDAGTFDLLIDGTVLAAGVGNGGTTGPQAVTTGTHTVSETAAGATSLAGYSTAITCLDGDTTVASGTGTSLSVDVLEEQNVVCAIANTATPLTPSGEPVITPTVAPIVAPPTSVRGAATVRGPRGCQTGTVLTRVNGRNIAKVRFFRDGRLVRTLTRPNLGSGYVLRTQVGRLGVGDHVVRARVVFVPGATPTARTLVHRFANCRSSVVTG
jgi:hypothetical protein